MDFDGCDISRSAQVNACIARTPEGYGRIDVLVANSGFLVEGSVESLPDDEWERCFDINVAGTFQTCRAVIPVMQEQRYGQIGNAASFAAKIPRVNSAAYAGSKAAVVSCTRALVQEFGPRNITANSYAPGMVMSVAARSRPRYPAAHTNGGTNMRGDVIRPGWVRPRGIPPMHEDERMILSGKFET